MAGLATVSALASTVSGTHSAFELSKKATPLFACSGARDYLIQGSEYLEESLKLMEAFKDALPHDVVHRWRVDYDK
jgi:hypothetical protein